MRDDGPNSADASPSRQSIADVLARLRTDARSGLTQHEAQQRLSQFGRNELEAEKPVPAWRKFLAQFTDVLVILLMVATAISAGLWLVRARIGAAVRSDRHLRHRAAERGHGLRPAGPRGAGRGGAAPVVGRARRGDPGRRAPEHRSPAELVPGDIIVVEEGDTIPADARVIESTALQMAEAALTGESVPVSKDVAADRRARSGSATRETWSSAARRPPTATARAVVTATGMQTEIGRIAGMLKAGAGGVDTAAEGTRPRRQDAGRRRRRHRGGDCRDDPSRRGRARVLRVLRRPDARRGAGGGGRAGRTAGGGDGGAVARRAAHGEAKRDRAPPRARWRRSARRTSSPRTRPARSPRTR